MKIALPLVMGLSLVLFVSFNSLSKELTAEDYPQILNELESADFHLDRTTLGDALDRYYGHYQVEIIKEKDPKDGWGLKIRFTDGEKEIHSWLGHSLSIFTHDAGDIIFYADFHPRRTGCEIVAYDLKNQKLLWRTKLRALGDIFHGKYFNRVNMSWEPHGLLVIYGEESAGRYIELVDSKSGNTVANRVLSSEKEVTSRGCPEVIGDESEERIGDNP